MNKNLEIEFKNMLTEDEYNSLIKYFSISTDAIRQHTNIYLDTNSFDIIKKEHLALRVRVKDNNYCLTLKIPQSNGLLELNQNLTEIEFNNLVNGIFPEGDIFTTLTSRSIDISAIKEVGRLTTHRYETPYSIGLLVLDYNIFSDRVDYELEFEVLDYEEGELAFDKFLEEFNIPKRPSLPKIIRTLNISKQ